MSESGTLWDLLKEYGIEFEKISGDRIDDILKKGYKKISHEEKEEIDSLFQYIPGLAVAAMETKDAVAKNKKMLDGAYKVSITEGMHLAKSRASRDAFRGSLLSNKNNQVAGQAELYKLEESLKLAQAPRYALCVFDALSVVTGQYFMAEINHKMASIEDKTNWILGYLENTTRGELWANDWILSEVIKNNNSIKDDEMQKNAYYQQILLIKKDSLSKIKLLEYQIRELMQKVDKRSKAKEIKGQIDKVAEYYFQYWYAICLYVKSVFCEIALADISNPIILDNMKSGCMDFIREFENAFEKDRRDLLEITNTSKAFNLKKLPILGVNSVVGQGISLGAIFLAYDFAASAENVVADNRAEKKRKLENRISDIKNQLGNTELVADQVKRIDDYKSMVCGSIEVLKIGDETYIKYGDRG